MYEFVALWYSLKCSTSRSGPLYTVQHTCKHTHPGVGHSTVHSTQYSTHTHPGVVHSTVHSTQYSTHTHIQEWATLRSTLHSTAHTHIQEWATLHSTAHTHIQEWATLHSTAHMQAHTSSCPLERKALSSLNRQQKSH